MPTKLASQRNLGKTGVKVPLIGFGAPPLGKAEKVPPKEAVRLLNFGINQGITYLHTSPSYGSEPHIGEVFLATKVDNRSKEGVPQEIKTSLKKLHTDRVDLIQVHAQNAWADLEQVMAKDGTVAALEQAKKDGLVRFLGITGHARPAILDKALEEYPFDTVLVALGMADRLVSSPETFLIPIARRKQAGVNAMKVLGHGEFPNKELALRYSINIGGVSLAIICTENQAHIDGISEMAADARPLSDVEMERSIGTVRPLVEEDSKAVEGEAGKE